MKYIKSLYLKDIDHLINLKPYIDDIDIKNISFLKHPSAQDSVTKYKDLFLKNPHMLSSSISIGDFIKKINIVEDDYQYIFNNPRLACEYAKEILKKSYFQNNDQPNIDIKYATTAEESISKDPLSSYIYIYSFSSSLRRSFISEAEKTIATDAKYSFLYAEYLKSVKGKIWTKGEDVISESPEYSYKYGRQILNGRFEKGEDAIATDPKYSIEYAKYLKEYKSFHWTGGEDIIIKSPLYSYEYAKDVIGGRWQKGEKIIITDYKMIYDYAVNVLDDKFDLGHDIIMNAASESGVGAYYKSMYVAFLNKKKYKSKKNK
jgi:hypothetical protein